MSNKIVFPEQTQRSNIIKIYRLDTKAVIDNIFDNGAIQDIDFYDSVDTCISENNELINGEEELELIEIEVKEALNLDLSNDNVVRSLRNIYNMQKNNDSSICDEDIINIYIDKSSIKFCTKSNFIIGDEKPYTSSKLTLGNKTVYNIIDNDGIVNKRVYSLVSDKDDTETIRVMLISQNN